MPIPSSAREDLDLCAFSGSSPPWDWLRSGTVPEVGERPWQPSSGAYRVGCSSPAVSSQARSESGGEACEGRETHAMVRKR